MASPDLLGLPNETKLNILAALPAKDIQRARRICTHLRDLIDEPSNFDFLVRNGRQRQVAQLRKNVNYLCDVGQSDFLGAVKLAVNRRGLWGSERMLVLGLQVATRWLLSRPASGDAALMPFALSRLFHGLTMLHTLNHVPYGRESIAAHTLPRIDTKQHFIAVVYDTGSTNWRAAFDAVGLTQEVMEGYYGALVDTPGGYFEPTIGCLTHLLRPGLAVRSWDQLYSTDNRATRAEEVCVLLGVKFEEENSCEMCDGESSVNDFTFHVRSECTQNKIRAVLEEEAESEEIDKEAMGEDYVLLSEVFGELDLL